MCPWCSARTALFKVGRLRKHKENVSGEFFGSIFVGLAWGCHGIGWNWSDLGPETPATPSHMSPAHTCARSPELLTQRPGPLLWEHSGFFNFTASPMEFFPSNSMSTNSKLAMSTWLRVFVVPMIIFLSPEDTVCWSYLCWVVVPPPQNPFLCVDLYAPMQQLFCLPESRDFNQDLLPWLERNVATGRAARGELSGPCSWR